MWEILAIILVAGLIGGYAGHLESMFPGTANPPPNSDSSETPSPTPQPDLKADLLIGLVASACVPALLKIMKVDLIDAIIKDPKNDGNWLYLAGLCLVAAYASRTFLSNFSNKVLKQQVAQLQAMVSELKMNRPIS